MSIKIKILCLDEFFVSDITDAMLLYGLIQALSDEGVIIITTSNIEPKKLYKDGLQRARFLPAIDLIEQQLTIYHITDGKDYRRESLEKLERFLSPINAKNEEKLKIIVDGINNSTKNSTMIMNGNIEINQRKVPFIGKSENLIWFSFSDLCESARSQLDYIWLAEQFSCIVISNIPILDQFKEEAAKRFLLLIDELYDQRINLSILSEVPIEQIYIGEKMIFEFKRLQSRLFEMQSKDYGK